MFRPSVAIIRLEANVIKEMFCLENVAVNMSFIKNIQIFLFASSTAEIKKELSYTSTPPYVFMA
jgi:hypothetical protein